MLRRKAPWRILCAAFFGLLLSGCGSGSWTTSPSADILKTGDALLVCTKLGGQVSSVQVYRVYAVDGEGGLSTTPPAGEVVGQVLLLDSQTADEAPSALGERQSLYKGLWEAMGARYPAASAADRAAQIADLDRSIEELHQDVQGSGQSIKDYVDFFEAVDAHLTHSYAEGELDNFLERIGTSPAGFLEILRSQGIGWNALLARMAARRMSFVGLYDGYARSNLPLGDYLRAYTAGTPTLAGSSRLVGAAATTLQGSDGGGGALDVAKFAWDIIKDNRPQTNLDNAYTSVLSSRDTNYEHYGEALSGESEEWHIWAENVFGITLASARLNLSGYYGAVNPAFGGRWLPSVAFTVDEAYAMWGFNLNANATITSFSNAGTVAAPEPEVVVVAYVQISGLLQNFTATQKFIGNGVNGFRKK